MKKILFILSAFLIVFSGFKIQAQTLEEILANHFETVGQDKLPDVQSIVAKGKIIQGNIEIPITGYTNNPIRKEK